MDRTLVRAESVSEAAVPDDAIVIDRLDRPSKRVCTILYIDAVQGEKALRSELLNGDAYVLRLPAEQQGQLGTGMLDGRVVTIGDADNQAYRIRTTREQIVEPAHTVVAIEVAADRKTFRDVVFATRIDVTLSPLTLSEAVRTRLERTIRTQPTRRRNRFLTRLNSFSQYLSSRGPPMSGGGSFMTIGFMSTRSLSLSHRSRPRTSSLRIELRMLRGFERAAIPIGEWDTVYIPKSRRGMTGRVQFDHTWKPECHRTVVPPVLRSFVAQCNSYIAEERWYRRYAPLPIQIVATSNNPPLMTPLSVPETPGVSTMLKAR